MPFTGPAEDRLAIREAMEHYADAVMQRDAGAWGEVWAEDSFWSLPEYPGMEALHGREAIVAAWKSSMGDYPGLAYIATPGSIVVEGDRASARTYTSEVFPTPNGGILRVRGQYDDELAKIGGRWLFTRRVYRTIRSD